MTREWQTCAATPLSSPPRCSGPCSPEARPALGCAALRTGRRAGCGCRAGERGGTELMWQFAGRPHGAPLHLDDTGPQHVGAGLAPALSQNARHPACRGPARGPYIINLEPLLYGFYADRARTGQRYLLSLCQEDCATRVLSRKQRGKNMYCREAHTGGHEIFRKINARKGLRYAFNA